MKGTTAAKMIDVLRAMFCTFGLPEHIVTDNGPQFVLEEFAMLMRDNRVLHTLPSHVQWTGGVVRAVAQNGTQG